MGGSVVEVHIEVVIEVDIEGHHMAKDVRGA